MHFSLFCASLQNCVSLPALLVNWVEKWIPSEDSCRSIPANEELTGAQALLPDPLLERKLIMDTSKKSPMQIYDNLDITVKDLFRKVAKLHSQGLLNISEKKQVITSTLQFMFAV